MLQALLRIFRTRQSIKTEPFEELLPIRILRLFVCFPHPKAQRLFHAAHKCQKALSECSSSCSDLSSVPACLLRDTAPPEFSYAVAEQSFFGLLKGFLNHFWSLFSLKKLGKQAYSSVHPRMICQNKITAVGGLHLGLSENQVIERLLQTVTNKYRPNLRL